MQGKICLITGATAGIGRETAVGLARRGATVVIVGRNRPKTEQVVAEIRAATGNAQVDSLLADLSSQSQIRALATKFRARYGVLHVLINNVGLVTHERYVTEDGIELQLAVNHLAGFLLTNLLLDALQASGEGRVINVSSFGYKKGRIDFDDLQFERGYDYRQAYYQTKLANVLFTLALARRLEGTAVTANCLHPGIVVTNLSLSYMGNPILRFFERFIAVSPARAAQTSLYLASSPQVAGVNGRYFEKKHPKPLAPPALDESVQERLWEVSAALTRLEAPTFAA